MKLSLNFLSDFIDIKDIDVKELAEQMTNVGHEYDEISPILSGTNLVIGEIVEEKAHPDSDHLHVCKVNVGEEILQIVCGAPNARKGIKVIVAKVGAKLPEIEIKKSNIRGIDSEGMMCSLLELGLDSKYASENDKNGIHELNQDAPIGENPIKYLEFDDTYIDFDLTSNRGDLLSVLGMAYEIGAIYNKRVKLPKSEYVENDKDFTNNFDLNVETENCKLFLVRRVNDVKISESPNKIKARLIASGIRPINNVVDISNYVMLEYGQPLHFYDADKINNGLKVRMAENDEKILTLDSIERMLSNEDIIIADKNNKAIGIAGVMGGFDTEVTENTKNIIIEAAIFDNIKVRKTSQKVLRSESSNRFEKGIDYNRTYKAIERAAELLEKIAEGKVQKGIKIYDNVEKVEKNVEVSFEKVNKLLGSNISDDEMMEIVNRLGFEVEKNNNIMKINIPSRRLDISIKEDIIEEIGRIYGVNNIESKPIILPIKQGKVDITNREIRKKLATLGLNETLTHSLVSENEAIRFTRENDKERTISVIKSIAEDKKYLRQSILTSLLKVYEYNKSYNIDDIRLFEISKAFYKENEELKEEERLGILISGEYETGLNKNKIDFYVLKGLAEEVLEFLGYGARYSFEAQKDIPTDFHPGMSAKIIVAGKEVGFMGRIHPELKKEEVYLLEINLSKLFNNVPTRTIYKEFSKTPSVKKDISILVDKNITAKEIEKVIKQSGGKILKSVKVFDVYTGKNIDENKKSMGFNLELVKENDTLTSEEMNETIDKIVKQLENKFSANLR